MSRRPENYRFQWHGEDDPRVVIWASERSGYQYHPTLEEARGALWNELCKEIESHQRSIRAVRKAIKALDATYEKAAGDVRLFGKLVLNNEADK